jgi:hypothetical protein
MLSWGPSYNQGTVPDPLRVLLATPLTIQLDFKNLYINLDPFAGVGLIPIRRPIAPGRMQYLKTVNQNHRDFEASLKDELRGYSPLQRKNSAEPAGLGSPESPTNPKSRTSPDEDLDTEQYNIQRSPHTYVAQEDYYTSLSNKALIILAFATFVNIFDLLLIIFPGFLAIYPLGSPRYGPFRPWDFQDVQWRRWPFQNRWY